MVKLTKTSAISDLAQQAPNPAVYTALTAADNQSRLIDRNINSLGELLTPDGEGALYALRGMGKQSMIALRSSLYNKGFTPDWPRTEAAQIDPASKIIHTLNLNQALELADQQYAIKTGEPAGEFSQKIRENTKAQQDGARLKGRRTL